MNRVPEMASFTFDIRLSENRLPAEQREQQLKSLGFGRVYTEHMVSVKYEEGKGWFDGRLEPYRPISLDPAAAVLHYGQAIFEGFKAFRQKDGGISTFRPDSNARRFQSSAHRLAMPEMPEELFIAAADLLIRTEADWVPAGNGESLYLRPFMIATEVGLGVRPSREYEYLLIGSPSGTYFPKGLKPVTVWISREYVRAAPGGTGHIKCAGNYAASLIAQRSARAEGCDQVVWLDACERSYVEEMGGMNLFFVYQENGTTRVVTPKLTGSLLPGVTRDALLQLSRDLGYESAEISLTAEQWQADVESGRMTEVFACGTAAAITPVGEVKSKEGTYKINGGETGPVAAKLRATLLALQHGESPDTHGWMHRVI